MVTRRRSSPTMELFVAALMTIAAATTIGGGSGSDTLLSPKQQQQSHQIILEHRHILPSSSSPKSAAAAAARQSRPLRRGRFNGAPAAATGTQTLNASDYILVGSAAVGTPPQRFTIAFRLWHTDSFFVGADASVAKGERETAPKRYNQRASTSAVADGRNFTTDYGDIHGHIVSDVLHFGYGLNVTVRFGVADAVLTDAYLNYDEYDGIDAIIGLSSNPNDTDTDNRAASNVSVMAQLATLLETPIVTTYLNRSAPNSTDWWGALTVGGEDSVHCVGGAYAYAPLLRIDDDEDEFVRIASVSLLNADDGGASATVNTTLPLNGTVLLSDSDGAYPMDVTDSIFALFVNATGGVYNPRERAYLVDCARVAQLPRFRLNLGADGATPVTLHPADYIHKWTHDGGVCELNVEDNYADGYTDARLGVEVILARDFHNNHCVAENLRERRLGFADAVGVKKAS